MGRRTVVFNHLSGERLLPRVQLPGAISGATRGPFPSVSVHFCPLTTPPARARNARDSAEILE